MITLPFDWRRRRIGASTAQTPGTVAADDLPVIAVEGAVEAPLLAVRHLRKCFAESSGLLAATLDVRRGEIHAIVGANGSGKTTLARIIAGVLVQDSGDLCYLGKPVRFSSPRQAQQYGIVAIHQEPQLVPELTVADNIFLGDELMYRRMPLLHRGHMIAQSMELLRDLGADFDALQPIARLGLAERQLVAIAKALHRRVALCILDEPTAALGLPETEHLFGVLRGLRARGVGVVYISHRLDEVLSLADRVTVMRDGRTVQTALIADASRGSLISQIVGPENAEDMPSGAAASDDQRPVALRVEKLGRCGVFQDVSFHIGAGEIFGLAGLAGAGRTEIARGIFGADHLDEGKVWIYGHAVRIRTPHDAIRAGIGMLSEDRKLDGLVLCQAANENVALTIWERIARAGVVTPRRGLRIAAGLIAQVGMRSPERARTVESLSAGNQQKIVLAKWLATLPKVLILDEPTRGVDITAKAEVHALIRHVAAEGIGVLVISSELSELLDLADRFGVVRRGRIAAEFVRGQATQEQVLRCALGDGGDVSQLPDRTVGTGIRRSSPTWPAAGVAG